MKLGKLLLMGMLSSFVFTACVDNDDKSEWNDGSQPVSFTSSIKGVKTRAIDTKWTAGDKVGIFMKAAGGELTAATGVNKLHTTDANGNLTASNAESALYYPTDGSSVDFIAYYPYSTSLAGTTYKVDVVSQTDQPAIDLLYSNNAMGFAKGAAAKPQLQFTHMLSQIIFNIEKDNTIPTLNGLKVTFKGMNTKADFALADGTLSNAGTPTDIVAAVNESTVKTIVLPAASLSGIKVIFDLNGKTYTTDYPQATLEAGRKYTHRVKLSDSNGQPVIDMDPAGITDWVEVPGGDIDVDFGGGSVTPSEVTLLDEPFDASQGAFTIDNKVLPEGSTYVWKWSNFVDPVTSVETQYMKASAFINKLNKASESWLISPAINLANVTDATLSFEHCHKFGETRENEMSVWVAKDGTIDWQQLTIPVWGTGNDYNYVKAEISLKPYIGQNVKVAFKYVSTTEAAATWQINAVKIVGTNGEGGGEVDPPTPGGVEKLLFTETLGAPYDKKPSGGWPYISKFTNWDNSSWTFTDENSTMSVRSIEYKTESNPSGTTRINNLWLPAARTSSLKITGINTEGYNKIKIGVELAADSYNFTSAPTKITEQDLNALEIKWNEEPIVIPSRVVVSSTSNIFYPFEISTNLGGKVDCTLIISASESKNLSGIRVANIKIWGTK